MTIMIPKPNQPGKLVRFVKQTHAKSVFSCLFHSISVDSSLNSSIFFDQGIRHKHFTTTKENIAGSLSILWKTGVFRFD